MDDLAIGEVYHVFTRGVEKRKIYLNNRDRVRFVSLLSHCLHQGPSKSYSVYGGSDEKKVKIAKGKGLVDLVAYCLMGNHFHLLLHENIEGGISLYMRRLLTSYSKYFNIRLGRVGSLFVHPFKAVLVEKDEQLLHVSRYIHLNPVVAGLIDNSSSYIWSSLVNYTGEGRAEPVVHERLIRSMMSRNEYKKFVDDQVDYEKSLLDIGHKLIDYED